MDVEKLKKLKEKGIFSKDEEVQVNRIINEASLGEKNIGVPDIIRYKYYLGFDATDFSKEDILNELILHCSPPEGIENFNALFRKYGHTSYGLKTEWIWYREDTLTLSMSKKGLCPIENATEEECWKMLALSGFYWQRFYEEKYAEEV